MPEAKEKKEPTMFGEAFTKGAAYGIIALGVIVLGDILISVVGKPVIHSLENLGKDKADKK